MNQSKEKIKLQLKKKLALLTLSSVMASSSLTGCASENKNTSDSTPIITQDISSEENIESNDLEYKNIAQDSYDKYKEFYEANNITIENLEVLTQILNSDYDNITPDDVRTSYALINQMILSDNMIYNINSSFFSENTEKKIYKQPRVSELVSNENEELKEFMIRTENLRDEVYDAYTVGTPEERKTANENAAKLVDYEAIQYRNNNSIMNNQYLTHSTRMLASEYEKNIIGILNSVSINQPEMQSTDGFTIYLISNVSANVDENGNIVYDYTGTDEVAFSDGEKLRKLLAQSEQGKYIETGCSELALIIKDMYEKAQINAQKKYTYTN